MAAGRAGQGRGSGAALAPTEPPRAEGLADAGRGDGRAGPVDVAVATRMAGHGAGPQRAAAPAIRTGRTAGRAGADPRAGATGRSDSRRAGAGQGAGAQLAGPGNAVSRAGWTDARGGLPVGPCRRPDGLAVALSAPAG